MSMEMTEKKGENHVIKIPESGAHDQKSTPPRGKEIANGEIIETLEPDGRASSSCQTTLAILQSHLSSIRRQGIRTSTSNHSASIYRVPKILAGMSNRAVEPEIVSIGPYHRGKEHLEAFENYKFQHLYFLFSRQEKEEVHFLQQLIEAMKVEEGRARECYSEAVDMSSDDFVMMMVIDGCFILELILRFGDITTEDSENDNLKSIITSMPWLLPIISRDLLKLENQIPFFLLLNLFDLVTPNPQNGSDYWSTCRLARTLSRKALKFFSLFRPLAQKAPLLEGNYNGEPKHLLHLFRSSKVPLRGHPLAYNNYHQPSNQPMQCVRQLWSSGVKFRPRGETNREEFRPRREDPSILRGSCLAARLLGACCSGARFLGARFLDACFVVATFLGAKFLVETNYSRGFLAASFLDITFNKHKTVLEIPTIHIDDLTNTILINCIAFEQYHSHIQPHFSAYIAFLSCLIKSARDVALLSSIGIIINSSRSDQQVAEFFRQLGEKVVVSKEHCYLSSEFRKVEDYYTSNLAKLRRTYFRRPWTFISVLSAAALLILTAIQTYAAISKH